MNDRLDTPELPIAEQELAEASAPCGGLGVGVPVKERHPGSHGGHPGGHPAGAVTPRQRHGGARSTGFRPGGGPQAIAYEQRTGIKAPRIIAWEIVDHIHGAGGMPVIGTNATMITDEIAAKMAEHRIPRISVSIDFPTAEGHDAFRGQPGCFDQTIAGINIAKRHGVGVQINTTVTTRNAQYIEEIHDLAESLGVDAFHIFMLVPTGRGADILAEELPPEDYERVLAWAYERQKTSPLHFKPTDAPHYYRIIRQLAKKEGRKVTVEEYGLDAMTRGCLGGITFGFISHTGDVQPCGYFDMQLGNVKEKPFSEIWTESKVFSDLRDYSLLKGKCGACEYKSVCGGCRARSLEITGDYLEAEPYCIYQPKGWR